MSEPTERDGRPADAASPLIEVHAVEDPSVYKLRSSAESAALSPVERAVLAMCRLILLSTVGLDPRRPTSPGRAASPAEAELLAADIEIQLDEALLALREVMRSSGPNQGISFHFSQGVVHVSGRLLKAGRATYADVARTGLVLDQCGIAEIALAKDVFTDDLKTLSKILDEFHRSPEPVVPERITPRIRLRPLNEAARRHENAGDNRSDGDDAIVHTYASAIVLMRRFYEGLRRGRYELPRRFRRIAQRLVDLSAGETPAFLGVTAARNANHDDAGRAVNTAVLSLAMARQITSDVLLLERIAMAALLYDTARPRLAGPDMLAGEGGASILPDLSEDEDAEVPAATAVVLTALGAITEASVVRTVLAYEAQWVKRSGRLGSLYRGLRPPLLQARIIATARALYELLTPAAGRDAMPADAAIATLEKEAIDAADRTVLRLLIGALGIFPTGTLVELSTGEVALVIQTPEHPALYSQPRVRLVFDPSGGAIDRLIEIDLAQAPAASEPARHIRKVVATSDDASASAMRSFASLPGGGAGSSSARHNLNSTPTGRSLERSPARTAVKPAPPPVGGLGREPSTGETPVSRARRTHDPATPPTPATIPESELGAHGGASAGSPPPPLAKEHAVPWAEDDGESTGPITRELPWHHRAFMLLIEQVEAHRLLDQGAGTKRRASRPHGAPAPTAEGTLARTPLVHLLVYMLDRGLSGTTVFQTPAGLSHAIYFFDGAPAKVKTGETIAPLDDVLLELGLLDEALIKAARAEATERRVLLGRHLVAKGIIDRETMLAVLNTQLVRKLAGLFAMERETQYAYYDGINLLEGYAGTELFSCEPLAMIMAGVRASAPPELVSATLERIGARAIMIHPEGDIRRFRLTTEETRVVELIRKQRLTVPEILRAKVASERVVRVTLYGLAITRHLDVGAAGRSPVGVVGGDSAVDVDPASIRGGAFYLREPPRSPAAHASPASHVHGPTTPHAPSSSVEAAARPVSVPVAVRPAPPAVTSGAVGMFTPLAGAVEPSGGLGSPPPPGVQPAAPPPLGAARPVEGPAPRATTADPARRERPIPGGVPRPGQRRPSPSPTAGSAEHDGGMPSSRRPPRDAKEIEAPPASARDRATPLVSFPPGDAGAVAERRAEIERRAAAIEKESYFAVLGVAHESTAAELQAAYFALAKKWHPDRIQGELADVKPLVSRVFTRVTEAYRTLSDPAKKAEYIRMLEQPGGGEQDEHSVVARAVDAALEFQKAEALLKKNDLAGAEALAKKAAQADPDQADYVALLVWIQALRRGNPPPVREGRSTGFYDDLIKTLDAVIAKEPQFERAIYYRATLLKRSGRIEKALADFRLVVQINPRNIDAAREVRLAGMRARAGAGASAPAPEPAASKGAPRKGKPDNEGDPPEGGGLLNKIFKR